MLVPPCTEIHSTLCGILVVCFRELLIHTEADEEQQNDQRKERISCKTVNRLGLFGLAKHRWKEGYDCT